MDTIVLLEVRPALNQKQCPSHWIAQNSVGCGEVFSRSIVPSRATAGAIAFVALARLIRRIQNGTIQIQRTANNGE